MVQQEPEDGFHTGHCRGQVPSTHEPDPTCTCFWMPAGMCWPSSELPTRPEMGRDPNTPEWVQHIAFKVRDRETLLQFRHHLRIKWGEGCWA